jgi:hypothetical protein
MPIAIDALAHYIRDERHSRIEPMTMAATTIEDLKKEQTAASELRKAKVLYKKGGYPWRIPSFSLPA